MLVVESSFLNFTQVIGSEMVIDLLYCTPMQSQAKDICLTLAQAFEAVFNKMKLVQNLHSSTERQ